MAVRRHEQLVACALPLAAVRVAPCCRALALAQECSGWLADRVFR